MLAHIGDQRLDPDSPSRRIIGTRSNRLGVLLAIVALLILDCTGVHAARWTGNGLEGGTVLSFAFDPTDADTILVGTFGGGVFRSTDGGETWRPSRRGMKVGLWIYGLLFDPADPDIVYAATNRGVHRSVDGGRRWKRVKGAARYDVIVSLTIASDTGTIVAGGFIGGAYRSTDGGETWQYASSGLPDDTILRVEALASANGVTPTIYAGIGFSPGGVFKSTDGGSSWSPTGPGLPKSGVEAIAAHPTVPTTLYVGCRFNGLWRSTDSGATWSEMSTPFDWPTSISIRSTNPAEMIVGTTVGVFTSIDSGANWVQRGKGTVRGSFAVTAFHPYRSSVAFVGATGTGAYKTTDGGSTWRQVRSGLSAAEVQSVTVASGSPEVVYAATLDGVFKSSDGGGTWSDVSGDLASHRIAKVVVDPTNPEIVYLAVEYDFDELAMQRPPGIYRSKVGGHTWTFVDALERTDLDLHPTNPKTIIASGFGAITRSRNRGKTWAALGTVGLQSGIRSVAMTPANAGVIHGVAHGDGVYRRDPASGHWFAINGPSPTSDELEIDALAVSPSSDQILFKGSNTLVYRTLDGGSSWLPAGLPSYAGWHALAFDPSRPTLVYAASVIGAWSTSDLGDTWSKSSKGLDDSFVRDLVVSSSPTHAVYAAAAGGVYVHVPN